MARSISVIAQTMFNAKAAEANLAGLTSTSQTSTWRLWIYIVASCINVLEQFQDAFKIELEAIATAAVPGTPQWVQDRTFRFQYDATTPEVLTIVDTEFVYATVDESKQIVTRCSVLTSTNRNVNIKVAKATSTTDDTPTQLAALEETALIGYWDLIGFAGINYNIINLVSDKIGIVGEIFYSGQYSATIQADVIAALTSYLANIPFDGSVKVLSIEDALQGVTGVSDFKLTAISGRANSTAFASRVKIYDLATGVNVRTYSTWAGYAVEEDTAGQDWATTLTFTAI